MQGKVRNAFKNKKWHFIAREELNSQVIIINEWHHQSIIPIDSTVMMPSLTAAPQKKLWKPVKQILNAVHNNHLLDYNNKTTLNEHHQTSNCPDNYFRTNLEFSDCRSGNGHLWRKKLLRNIWSWKNDFCKQLVSLHTRFPKTRKLALNNLPS